MMIEYIAEPVVLANDASLFKKQKDFGAAGADKKAGEGTMAYSIMRSRSKGAPSGKLRIAFDSLISHDITYVGVVQTARASGMKRFPVRYVLTNCHNSLCAVGGTINEDDHVYGLSAAKKYGGIYVPANLAVIHQYARERLCECGAMTLGSDSHTRYGALGAMGVGEGGPELVKQLLGDTYDIDEPDVVLIWLEGSPRPGVGPHDVALALCEALYGVGAVKNKVMEFSGPGLAGLPMDFRLGVDVMTTETTCLSSIWRTDDEKVSQYYAERGRSYAYKPIAPAEDAVYHAAVRVNLSKIEPMIAAPFHPSNVYKISSFIENARDILRSVEKEAEAQFGKRVGLRLVDKAKPRSGGGYDVFVDQGVIAGCAGGMYDNIREAAAIMAGASVGHGEFSLSIYPPSLPVAAQLSESGIQNALYEAGALFKPCFCGPCFGAGDVPANNALSIRHATRNFINREGSRPGDGQLAAVALMDARSIAATAANGGILTPATECSYRDASLLSKSAPRFNSGIYEKRVYDGSGGPLENESLKFGPNIADWPKFEPLGESVLLRFDSVLLDPVTTTDELIPSGEASSYRSNPEKLAQFALSRRDPGYVARAVKTREMEEERKSGAVRSQIPAVIRSAIKAGASAYGKTADELAVSAQIGSVIFARSPGDGSAREQAASCQRVLGGLANICQSYATKRYRSNVINWGMLPFTTTQLTDADVGDWIYVPGVRSAIIAGEKNVGAFLVKERGDAIGLTLTLGELADDEKETILAGCLINKYRMKMES